MSTAEEDITSKVAAQTDGPSLIKKLKERADQQLELKTQEIQKLEAARRDSEKKKKKGILKNRFKLRKDSKEASDKVKRLSRKEFKRLKEDYKKLSKLSQRELMAYKMLTDPNNQFMNKLTLRGEEGLQELQRENIWQNIAYKKQLHHDDINDFMNSLSDDEFTEFIQNRDASIEKINETGRQKEVFGFNLNEHAIHAREQMLQEQSMKRFDLQQQEEVKLEDISKEFKVFRDPTFDQFIQIVGCTHDENLPLFAQLYILKEILQFYQMTQNQSFIYLCFFNVLLNISYFYVNHKLLYKKSIPFFSLSRIFIFFVFSQILQENLITKLITQKNYRVNLNDLFDQDEDFLFENEHFRALIRKTKNEFEYLVNPVFDLEEIYKNAKQDIDDKYKKPDNGNYPQMNQGDLIELYARTFNAPKRSRMVYGKMIEKYDKFFEQEKKLAEANFAALSSGRQIHDLIKHAIEFYDDKDDLKRKIILSLEPEAKQMYKDTKKQLDQFVDGLIETLNNEFDERSVSVHSSRRDKIQLLQKLQKELDAEYSDTEKFLTMVKQNQEDLLSASISKEKQEFIPKPDLKYKEWVAIKGFYSAADFERNSFLTLTLPVVSSILWFMQRAARRLKWL